MPAQPPQLDLSSLRSYSPEWPAALRFAVCIATKYAGQRLVQRARALTTSPSIAPDASEEGADIDEEGNPIPAHAAHPQAGSDSRRKAKEYVAAWEDFCQKFLSAVCQHLGVEEESLPSGGEIRLEDVVEAGQGRVVQDDKEEGELQLQLLRREQDAGMETGSVFWRQFAAEGRSKRSDAVEELREAKKEEQREEEQAADAKSAEDEMDEAFEEKVQVEEKPQQSGRESRRPVRREGGALHSPEGQGREFEVFNDLLLIALGLGQYRSTDGATTLFEQEAIFDDPSTLPSSSSKDSLADKTEAQAQAQTQEPEPKPSANPANDAASATWSSIRAGAASSWAWTSNSASKVGNAVSSRVNEERREERRERKARQATKPNEVCHYDARARAMLFTVGLALGIEGREVWDAEKALGQTIHFVMEETRNAAKKQGQKDPLQDPLPDSDSQSQAQDGRTDWMNESGAAAVQESRRSNWRKWAAASGGFALGGVILGVTGGLAAPLVVPALAGLTGITFLATSGGVIMLGALVGVTGGGLAGYRVHRRLRGLEGFEFRPVQTAAREAGIAVPSLHATVCVSGLLLREVEQCDAWRAPWSRVNESRDVYVVSSEAPIMAEAGQSLRRYVVSAMTKQVGQKAATEVVKRTVLAPVAAITLPLSIAGAMSAGLDSLFVRAKSKAVKQGLILAETLRAEVQGHRPVTLIGASLGSVAILSCLTSLAQDDPSSSSHLIDSVYLICSPCTPPTSTLRRARSVVARRFVNAYSSKRGDMVCGIAAWLGMEISLQDVREGKAGLPRVLGSGAVQGVPGVENVDVGGILGGSHFDWVAKTEDVLRYVGALDA